MSTIMSGYHSELIWKTFLKLNNEKTELKMDKESE